MPSRQKPATNATRPRSTKRAVVAPDIRTSVDERLSDALARLRNASSKRYLEGLTRYGIPTTNAIGVAMDAIQKLGKGLGRDHALAERLWESGIYEARLLASYVAEPERTTKSLMDRWCRDFDSWGICDTLCFVLFDKAPDAWSMVTKWATRRNEFEKRAAFALLASLAGHDRVSSDDRFLAQLPLLERAADDDRNYVWKGVSWALRRIGGRSIALHAASLELAERLSTSASPSARRIGKETIKDLSSAATQKRLAAAERRRR